MTLRSAAAVPPMVQPVLLFSSMASTPTGRVAVPAASTPRWLPATVHWLQLFNSTAFTSTEPTAKPRSVTRLVLLARKP